ncbi:MAG: hypothetical protein UDK34_03680, partial [Cyanobacteriota bacterium]|nr:hypothetical protein [Cyanobacteriota bacterium]
GCVYVPPSYSPIKGGSEEMKKWDPEWANSSFASKDNYWAGAKKACDELGMSLPDKSKLESLAKKTKAEKEQLGLPTSGWFWSSSEDNAYTAYRVFFGDGRTLHDATKLYSDLRVLCVGD